MKLPWKRPDPPCPDRVRVFAAAPHDILRFGHLPECYLPDGSVCPGVGQAIHGAAEGMPVHFLISDAALTIEAAVWWSSMDPSPEHRAMLDKIPR